MDRYLLLEVAPKRGRLNENIIWHLTWLNMETREVWTQTIDDSFGNWRKCKWDRFVTEPVYGIYTNLRETERQDKNGYGVISSDQRPTLLEAGTWEVTMEAAKRLLDGTLVV